MNETESTESTTEAPQGPGPSRRSVLRLAAAGTAAIVVGEQLLTGSAVGADPNGTISFRRVAVAVRGGRTYVEGSVSAATSQQQILVAGTRSRQVDGQAQRSDWFQVVPGRGRDFSVEVPSDGTRGQLMVVGSEPNGSWNGTSIQNGHYAISDTVTLPNGEAGPNGTISFRRVAVAVRGGRTYVEGSVSAATSQQQILVAGTRSRQVDGQAQRSDWFQVVPGRGRDFSVEVPSDGTRGQLMVVGSEPNGSWNGTSIQNGHYAISDTVTLPNDGGDTSRAFQTVDIAKMDTEDYGKVTRADLQLAFGNVTNMGTTAGEENELAVTSSKRLRQRHLPSPEARKIVQWHDFVGGSRKRMAVQYRLKFADDFDMKTGDDILGGKIGVGIGGLGGNRNQQWPGGGQHSPNADLFSARTMFRYLSGVDGGGTYLMGYIYCVSRYTGSQLFGLDLVNPVKLRQGGEYLVKSEVDIDANTYKLSVNGNVSEWDMGSLTEGTYVNLNGGRASHSWGTGVCDAAIVSQFYGGPRDWHSTTDSWHEIWDIRYADSLGDL